MSLQVLVTGALASDPQRRQSAKGTGFATGSLRSGSGDEAIFINVISFGEAADRLLQLRKGDTLSVAGRGELRAWTGKNGTERTGLSVVVSEIAATRPRPRPRQRDDETRPEAGGQLRAQAGVQGLDPQRRPELSGDGRLFDDEIPF